MSGGLKSNFFLLLQPFASKVVAYFVIPIYTLCLSPAEYGYVEYILTIGIFFKTFISMSTSSSFWKFITDKNNWDYKVVVFNILLIPIVLGVFIILIYLWICYFVGKADLFNHNILIYFLSETIAIIYLITNLLIRHRFVMLHFVMITICYIITFVGFNYLFVYYWDLKSNGVFYSYLFSNIFVGLLCLNILTNSIRFKFDWKLTKEIIKYSFPLMLSNIVVIIMLFSNKLIIRYFAGDYDLGIFSYGYKYGSVLKSFIFDCFFIIWNPIRWSVFRKSNYKEVFNILTKCYYVLCPLMSMCVITIIYYVAKSLTLDVEYMRGIVLMPFISISTMLWGIYYFAITGLLLIDKTKIIFYITLCVTLLNVIMNLVLAKEGYVGACIAMFISNFILLLLGQYFNNKHFDVGIKNSFFIKQDGLYILMGLLFFTIMYVNISILLILVISQIFYLIFNLKELKILFVGNQIRRLIKILNDEVV